MVQKGIAPIVNTVFSKIVRCALSIVMACSLSVLPEALNATEQAYASSTKTVTRLTIYPYTVDSAGKWAKEVKRTKDSDGLYWAKGGITEKAGQLRMNVEASWSDGVACMQSDDDWRDVDLEWKSSNKKVAVVSSNGTVTATGNGSVTITVTDEADGVSAKLGIKVSGQEGATVTAVYICNESGTEYEDERITYTSSDSQLKFYAREEFSDGTTASNAPKAKDYDKDALTTITWSVSDSDSASINSSTGVFIAKSDALKASGTTTVKVYATATGGGADSDNGVVRTHAYVNIKGDGSAKTGEDAYASDSLTVHVVYDKYPDYTVKTLTYTIDELKALETVRSTYTFSRSSGEYVTPSGEGIYLTTLISEAGLTTDQVKSFTFTANDGVNPGKMTYSYLFRSRWYWPNYEFSNNQTKAVNVYPMLAWASDWRDSKDGATNCDADYSNLPTKTRLRLLFGSATTSDNSTDHSLKYISEMTIRIKGAPSSSHGDTDQGNSDSGNDTAGKTTGNGDNGGTSSGQTSGTSTSTANGQSGSDALDNKSNNQMGTTSLQSSGVGSKQAVRASSAASTASGQNASAGTSGSSRSWQAYEMINPTDNSALDIDELDSKNALLIAFAVALAILVLAIAGKRTFFRKGLGT